MHLNCDVIHNEPIATRDVNGSVPAQIQGGPGPGPGIDNEKVEPKLFRDWFLGSETKTVNEKMELELYMEQV